MALVTSKQVLINAQRDKYAVGAFNIENMEMAQAVIEAAEELNAPVIIQTTPSTVKYAGLPLYYSMIEAIAKNSTVPVILHLDHGNSFALAIDAIVKGYTSVMIDGSHLKFDENIDLTKKVVCIAEINNIPVEAELGKVGGKEDSLDGGNGAYTDPFEAQKFVEQTNVSSLAVAIGTAHGVYDSVPKLDIDRLKEIQKIVSVPIVLHGASGIGDEEIKHCIKNGICKVNFATELRIAYSDAVKNVLKNKPNTYDPKEYGKAGREAVKALVKNRIIICGCDGKY